MANISYAQRGPMLPLTRRMRAYFAPVDRVTGKPTFFDPARGANFSPEQPPAPWMDAGWVKNFTRKPGTQIVPLRAGARSVAQGQYRSNLDARVEFDFCQWGKLQMALSSGSQHMNVLESLTSFSPRPSGGLPENSIDVIPGSTASEIVVGLGNVDFFAIGDLLAVDSDYTQQTGYVGTGIPGAFVKSAADVLFDPHYIRRVTFNVGRISGKTLTSLLLAQPLPGGAPRGDFSLQRIVGFVDREGGSFFQEWSALFMAESETGARVFYHYPRLQPAAPAEEFSQPLLNAFEAWSLRAKFIALPTRDINDSEQALCYRSFIPGKNAALY